MADFNIDVDPRLAFAAAYAGKAAELLAVTYGMRRVDLAEHRAGQEEIEELCGEFGTEVRRQAGIIAAMVRRYGMPDDLVADVLAGYRDRLREVVGNFCRLPADSCE